MSFEFRVPGIEPTKTNLNQLPAMDPGSGRLNVIVDTPKGRRNKYKFDERNGVWRLSKCCRKA